MGPKKLPTRKKKVFLPGGTPWNKGVKKELVAPTPRTRYTRLTKEDLLRTAIRDQFGDFIHHTQDIASQSFTSMLLRPRNRECSVPLEKMRTSDSGAATGHRIIDIEKLAEAMTEVCRQHNLGNRGCRDMKWLIPEEKEEIRGLAVSACFKCQNCDFQSTAQKLYKETTQNGKGRRRAVPNMALQVGLYQSSIGNAAATRILTSMSIPVAAGSSLQDTANKCGEIMAASNEEDMAQKRNKVKDILEYKGLERDTPIDIEIDRQYNIPLSHARGKTPFAPATQTRDIVAENVSKDKYIIAYNSTNKLCRIGQRLIREGKEPTCPHHSKCTANIRMSENIGNEMLGGEQCAEKLLTGDKTQLFVGGVTSDSDGHFHRGIKSVMERESGNSVVSYLCVSHLKRSLSRRLDQLSLSPTAFPGSTARLKKKQQKSMAEDISHRVQAELQAAHQITGDLKLQEDKLGKCGEAILLCYSGNHELCHSHSFVCQGNFVFPYLALKFRQRVNFNMQDEQQILQAVNHRLSSEMLHRTRFHSSTQKAESMNSAFRVTNPKHSSLYSRNGANRDHSAIQLTNSGPASILTKAAAAKVPLEGGTRLKN